VCAFLNAYRPGGRVSSADGDVPVLVVEDDADLRTNLVEVIEGAGYTVRTAGDGREALGVLRGSTARWIVLLDLVMPVMDGFAVIDELRRDRSLPRADVIVMTGGSTSSGMLGELPLLQKPFDP